MMRWTCEIFLLVVIVCFLGCDKSGLGDVSGTITLDGQPLVEASVIFEPFQGGRFAAGRTDHKGNYSLIYTRSQKKVPPGKYLVRISTYDEYGDDEETIILEERIPLRYNFESDLVAEVAAGKNSFDFALDSSGEIAPPPDDSEVESDQREEKKKKRRNNDEETGPDADDDSAAPSQEAPEQDVPDQDAPDQEDTASDSSGDRPPESSELEASAP